MSGDIFCNKCNDGNEVREISLLANSGGWKPNGRSGWGSSEHAKRRGPPNGVKQGGTAGTSSRPCSLNATGVRAFYSFFGQRDKQVIG